MNTNAEDAKEILDRRLEELSHDINGEKEVKLRIPLSLYHDLELVRRVSGWSWQKIGILGLRMAYEELFPYIREIIIADYEYVQDRGSHEQSK